MFANKPKFGTEYFRAGETIVREGDVPDKFYVIVKGEVDILQQDDSNEQIINRLGARQFFGEIGILRTEKRTATVRASTDVEVMSLNRSVFLNWLSQSETIHQKISQAIDQRIGSDEQLQHTQAQTAEPESPDPTTNPEQFNPGSLIVRQGEDSDHFYIILEGEVEVFHTDPNDRDVVIARLGKGEYFGEIGLLVDRPRITSVRAVTHVKTISFDREEFATWMSIFPSGQHGIKQTARQRLRTTTDLLRKKN